MAIAAANLVPCERLVTLAAPWNFTHYPDSSRRALQDMWRHAERRGAEPWGAPDGSAAGRLLVARSRAHREQIRRIRAARSRQATPRGASSSSRNGRMRASPALSGGERADRGAVRRRPPGLGRWQVAASPSPTSSRVPMLHLTATRDLIAPAATAPSATASASPSGHVGMIVGSARKQLHEQLAASSTPLAAKRPRR